MVPLPIRDENPSPSSRVLLLPLIAVNIAAFVWEVGSGSARSIILDWGFVPADPAIYRWFTSQFLHGGFMHLAGNMWFLWLFGDNVEGRLGRWFLPFYLLCGVCANGFDGLARAGSAIPAIGASGAISGVLGAYFVWFPHARLECVWTFGFYWPRVSLPAYSFGLIYVGWQLLMSLVMYSLGVGGGVAYAAHLGGALVGAASAYAMRRQSGEAVSLTGPTGSAPGASPAARFEALSLPAAAVRRDPYHAQETEEGQLGEAENLLASGHPHLARAALRKLLLRHPRGRLRLRAQLAMGRLLQDWFRDFAASRSHLREALLQDAMSPQTALGAPEAQEARGRLERIEAVLKKTFVEEPSEAERYWVVRESGDPLIAGTLGALAAILGVPASSVGALMDNGILARDVLRAEAARLAQALEARGVFVLVLPQKAVLLLPPPERVEELKPTPAGLEVLFPGATPLPVAWDRCLLVAAAAVRSAGTHQHLLEVFTMDPLRRLRWLEPPGERSRFFEDLRGLLQASNDVPADSGAMNAWEDRLPLSSLFADADSLDRRLQWELQLAYQKKEGVYRPA